LPVIPGYVFTDLLPGFYYFSCQLYGLLLCADFPAQPAFFNPVKNLGKNRAGRQV
jgi:hypothetical protein